MDLKHVNCDTSNCNTEFTSSVTGSFQSHTQTLIFFSRTDDTEKTQLIKQTRVITGTPSLTEKPLYCVLQRQSLLTASWLSSTYYPVFRRTFLEWHVISREMCEAVYPLRAWFCLTFNCRMCYYKSRRYYFNRLIFTPLRFTPAVFIELI